MDKSITLKFGVGRWLNSGEVTNAFMTDAEHLRQFAHEQGLCAEGDTDAIERELQEGSPDIEIAVAVCEVPLDETGSQHDLKPALDALITLDGLMENGEIHELLCGIFAAGFNAGAEYQKKF